MMGIIPKRMKTRRREERMAEESEASVADVVDHNDKDSILLMMKVIDSYMNQKLGYDQLEDETRQVLLLCGVHGPSLLVSDLLKYVIGLGVFKHVTSIDDARCRLYKILVHLEKSLLVKYNVREVKVSALLFRVASIIASKNHNTFTRDTPLEHWPGEDFFATCTQIILKCCNIQILPQRLNCPNLYFLYIESSDDYHTWEIPDSFFEGVEKLQVLVLIGMTISSLPASLVSLANLKTLCFNYCSLQDMVGIGGLKSLEILSFFKSSMKELPSDIGQLTDHLKMLDLSSSKIEVPPKIISNLTKLEELYMGAMQKEHDILAELMHLTSLTALELQIPQDCILPSGMIFIFEKLKRYNLVIGEWEWSDSNETSRLLKLKLDPSIHVEKEIKAIVESAEALYLEINGFEVICPQQLAVDQISEKLKVMKAKSCGRLEYLFSVSKINKFSQTVEIEVSECSSMKNIVLLDSGTTIDEIESIPMHSLTLQHLPAINSFCSDDSKSLNIPTLFPNEKALFRHLKHLKLINISRIMLLVITAPSNRMVPLQNLETMEIGECNDLQYLFVIEGHKMHENDGGLLPELCRLHLHNLGKLRSIVGLNHPIRTLSFKMLKRLTVCSCNQLRYLLPLYVHENLQQLEHIEIRECEMLERVFGDEEEDTQMRESNETIASESNETTTGNSTVQLLKVMSLILQELPNLSGFCQGGRTVEWPSLEAVKVAKCDKIEKYSLGMIARPLLTSVDVNEGNAWANNEDRESNIKYLFHLTGQLPSNDTVTIKDSEELKKNMELLPLLPKQLKTVKASHCDNELSKFLSILFNQLNKLERLTVENCELLEQVFDLKELVAKGQSPKFPNLDTMQLRSLPNLKCIWNKDPTGIEGLVKLVNLEIIECGLRKGPLSDTSVEKLVHLKELKIESCEMIEQIIEGHMGKQEISFPNLKDLRLVSLPMLIKFNSGHCNVRFPNLQILRIEKCPELNTFTTGFLSKTTNEGTSNPVPSNAKMGACSKLQTLKLVGHESFEKIWESLDSNIPECQLKDVEVDSFSKLRYIFPSSMLPTLSKKLERLVVMNCSSLRNVFQMMRETDLIKGFQNLKSVKLKGCESIESLSLPSNCPELTKIDISDCQSLTDIFIDTEIKADDKCFPNLESIVLQNLPMLSSFSLEISEFPSLQKVRIVNCPAIKTFSRKVPSKTDSSESRPFGHGKTRLLSQLQELELGDLPNMQLWNQEPQIHQVFKNLTTLKIIGCGSIEKLFSISLAQHLTSLKWLTLYKCGNMVQVLGGGGGGNSKQVFHKLETLVLKHLPRLTSFCEEDVDFDEFPELKMVRVENVPKMYTFVRQPLKTPKLKQVQVTFIKKCWRQNLNQTIEYLHENHDELRHEVWESDQINGGLHTDAAESSSQGKFKI